MASSATLSVANASLQANGKGFSDFSGLRNSASVPFGRKTSSDDFLSVIAFQTSAVGGSSGYRRGVTEAKLKVAINGFGRIGRNFLRCWHGRKDSPLDIIAINDTGGVKQASHLLKYDSTLGIFDADVKPSGDKAISVDGKIIQVVSNRNPANLPWKELGIDLVIEGTGVFVDRDGAGKHIQAGAKKVLITAPGKGDIPTYVVGVNADAYSHGEPIISNASCTTNCLAPFVKVLDQKFGIIKGTMTTTHSYTGDQRLLDASHRDLRRARAAALNIVPTSTGAAKAVALVLPTLKGKLNGIALRVPTPNVSVVDLVVQVSKKTFAEEVNAAFRESAEKELIGILSVCDEPLVSVDFRCSDVSSTVDSSLTMVMGDDMVKLKWSVLHAAMDSVSMIFSSPSPHMQKAIAFLQNPTFLHGFSASFHLGSLIFLFIIWIVKRFKIGGLERRQETCKGSTFFGYKATLFTCLGLSLFHLFLCIFNYFYWCRFGWSEEYHATQLDLVVRTLVWLTISAYLHFDFSQSYGKRFPTLLRIWWGSYFLISCSFIVVNLVYYRKPGILPTHMWVLDFGSVLFSLFLCYTGFVGKRNEEVTPLLQEPLLNGTNDVRSCEVTPYQNAGLLSILTFSWMGPLMKVGNLKTLDLDDVPQVTDGDSAKNVCHFVHNKLQKYCRNSSNSGSSDPNCRTNYSGVGTLKLAKVLLFSVWKEALLTGFLAFLNTSSSYVGPYLIDTFVQYLNGRREYAKEGYALVSAFVIAKLVECLSQRHWFFRLQQAGIRVRAALVAMLYKKSLALSSRSKQHHTNGEIINFMAVDAEQIGDFSWFFHDIWMIPLQIMLSLLILYKNLGLASVSALAATVLLMLANFPLGKFQEKYQEKMMKSKDVRMKATSEILRNMRILKLQGWEMKFLSKIIELRKNEENWLKKFVYTSATMMVVFWGAPTFVAVVTFVSCMLMGIPLESGKVLSSLATFRILQEPIYILPDMISMVVKTKVSLDRIASFLCLEDLDPDAVQRLPNGSSNFAIEISNGNFSWDLSSANPTLKDINFQVLHGMRVAVCGTVGSGKSSLLSCILGEVPKISGTIKLCGTKAYVAQSPWIQSGNIEENILFGKEMDPERYESVLEACSLKKDLDVLSFGDQTVIGERGINLSGGQKQRIQIARALYQDADIYLFDDPFSAVDAHTGTHLFKECILGLLGSKTVIYVTHQVEFLPAADLILVMRGGKITQAGKYNDILNSGTDFKELVSAHQLALSAVGSMGTVPDTEVGNTQSFSNNSLMDSSSDIGKGTNQKEEDKRDEKNDKTEEIVKQAQLVQEEEREKGRVGLSVYWKYITISYKGLLVPLLLLAQILFQILQIGSNYWMALATPVSKDATPLVKSSLLILVYVSLALGSSFFILMRALLLVTAGYRTATILFNKMHMCIFRAPMAFFDATPSGRILNRASTDQSDVDLSIPNQMGSFAFSVIQLIGIIVVMSQVAWQVFIIFIPVIAICIWYQKYYIAAARELARLIGVCKAPCIQHFAESLSGSMTIRSFDQELRFSDKNFRLTDGYSRPKFHNVGARDWLCFRLDLFSSLTFAFSLVFLISMPKGMIDPGIAGLAVTYGLNLNMLQAMVIWNLCNVENKIISVERIFQYMRIPSEPPLVLENHKPGYDWPTQGEVDIRDLQVRYAPHMPLVLRGVTCIFPGGMKTGIVGRTGSGKSTLIQTLFRIVDPVGGQILIDGVDISTIGLHDLRSRLSIIPQDPTMFEGTLRSNLDPLGEYNDEQIWEALDKCQLGEEVRRKEGKLESAVVENGENWSMGQRQLVCLGRVILKRSKVLVLDEATASVDTATDNLIQQTLRQQFSDSTVITIAHRMTSVLDSDMVLLLDNGVVAEYDSPAKLLENKASLFAKLVAEYSVRSTSSFENSINL